MRRSLASKLVTILLAQSVSSSFVFAQQGAREEIRPRRAQDIGRPVSQEPAPIAWQTPPQTLILSFTPTPTLTSDQEPTIRVALSTNARSGSISTAGRLMNSTDLANTLVALDVARGRVEPHLLSPLPVMADDSYRIKVEGAASRVEAEERSREIHEAIGEDCRVAYDMETKNWVLLLSPTCSREEAEELRGRLEDAGFDATVAQAGTSSSRQSSASLGRATAVESPNSKSLITPDVRLVSRT